jgi:hypothetical protein
VRLTGRENLSMQAALIGEPSTLKERIQNLLQPLPFAPGGTTIGSYDPLMLVAVLTLALAAGAIFGERLIRALFLIAA